MNPGSKWLDPAIQLIRQSIERLPDRGDQKRRLAAVHPDPDAGPGWFLVRRRLNPSELDSISEGDLRNSRAKDSALYDVLEVSVEGDQVRVRVSLTAPRRDLDLYVPAVTQRLIMGGLADGLTAVRDNPILKAFASRELDPLLPSGDLSQVHGWTALKPAQQEAVAACCARGLQLIWGPPGTGKTHVIASSIEHLADIGRRVLLVSSTNIAVDNALHEAVRVMSPIAGQVVRVGAIHLPELASDGRVNIDRLAEARQEELQQELASLSIQLDQLAVAREQLTAAEASLADFDAVAYEMAAARVANREALTQQRSEFEDARTSLGVTQTKKEAADRSFAVLRYREAASAEREVRDSLASVRDELDRLEGKSWRERRRAGQKNLQGNRGRLTNELATAEAQRRESQKELERKGVDPGGYGDLSRTRIQAAVDGTGQAIAAYERRLQDLTTSMEALIRSGLPGPADIALTSEQRHLWEVHAGLDDLRQKARSDEITRARIASEYDKLQNQMVKEKKNLQKEIVSRARVVGTTLTQIALRPWITEQQFDHVIVDEAAAAQYPHLIHAVGRARVGAVLVGDYLQNGPIVAGLPRDAGLKELFGEDVFAHFGATEPAHSSDRPGCVVLTEQFRFGPALTELANRVAYDGVLVTAGTRSADIVVVTVDGLPEQLRTIDRGGQRQAGWWPIGGLLARALAEYHQDGGTAEAFGVVVPYSKQREATEAILQDANLSHIPVGTSHAFQGRQFVTVLADLVEDGNGWVAGAHRHGQPHDLDGLRLFNVAATRPKNRLYVLLTKRALLASRGGPLSALRAMTKAGTAHLVDAGELVGISASERPPEGTPESTLLEALDPYVRVVGIHDEDAAIGEVIIRIDEAQQSVWCWSAWVGKHAEGIASALERARNRGVEVHLLTRPAGQVQGSNRDSLQVLARRLPHVVFIRDMHQKLVVVDKQTSIFGSMNLLSHGRTPSSRLRDVMVTVDGSRFADRMLAHEHASELARHQLCRTCHQPLTECGRTGRDQRWAWLCTNRGADDRRHPPLYFPAGL